MPDGPYPGLRPFEPHEWSIFFGREVMTADVIAKLGHQNLIIVHGASGCGKSSLVRAGVLPLLQSDHDLNRRDFRYAVIRPSQGPMDALAAVLLAQLGPANGKNLEESWLDRLAVDQDLIGTIEERLKGTNATFCLVIDQFEEIFRWAEERDRAEAEFLVDFIRSAAGGDRAGRNFFVLVTMRSDYLGQCAQFRDFAGVVNDCQYLLDNLDEFGILRAIHEPAERFSGSVDPALADRLRFAAKDDTDALPILQHTLMRMYDSLPDREPGWTLGLAVLEAVSGQYGPLSEHAEAIYLETVEGAPERAVAVEWMFRTLTDLDAGGRAIRRPRPFAELVAVCNTDKATIEAIVEAFSRPGRNFLVVAESEHGAKEVDVSHEALIRRWRRIGDNSVDADTGQRTGWLYREFQAGLIWKALAVFAKRGETTLEPAMTEQWLRFFDEVENRPSWAARYFVDPVPGVSPEKQPEWTGVMALIAASKARLERESKAWRRALTRYWALLAAAALLLIAVGVYWGVDLQRQNVVAKNKAFVAEQAFRTAEQRTVISRQVMTLAQADAERARIQLRRAHEDSRRAQADMRQAQAEMRQAKERADQFQRAALARIAATEAGLVTAQAEAARAELGHRDRTREMERQFTEYSTQVQQMMAQWGSMMETELGPFVEDSEDLGASNQARHPAVSLPDDFRAGLRSLMAEMGAPAGRAEAWADEIESLRAQYQLNTDQRLAAFVAAAALGTNGFTSFEEQLDFARPEAIRESFPEMSGDPSAFVHRPRELANHVYAPPENEVAAAGEYATGNREAEDGWTYRGRGLIFARGRSDYERIGGTLGVNLLAQPELVNDPQYLVRAALERWRRRDGNERADIQNLLSVARRVVGLNHNRERIFALEERARQLIARALERAQRDR